MQSSSNLMLMQYANRYALSAATAVMFWMVVKKPPTDVARRVRQNKEYIEEQSKIRNLADRFKVVNHNPSIIIHRHPPHLRQ